MQPMLAHVRRSFSVSLRSLSMWRHCGIRAVARAQRAVRRPNKCATCLRYFWCYINGKQKLKKSRDYSARSLSGCAEWSGRLCETLALAHWIWRQRE